MATKESKQPAVQCIIDLAKLASCIKRLSTKPTLDNVVCAEALLTQWSTMGEALQAEVKTWRASTTLVRMRIKATLNGQRKEKRLLVNLDTKDEKTSTLRDTTIGDVANMFPKRRGNVGETLLYLEDGTPLDRSCTLRSLGDKVCRLEAKPGPGAKWHLASCRVKVAGLRYPLRIIAGESITEILTRLKPKTGLIYIGIRDKLTDLALAGDIDLHQYYVEHPTAKFGIITITAPQLDI